MAALPNGVTQEDFYNDSSLQGGYQYVSLKEIVNDFMLTRVNDMNHIKYIERDIVIFYAKNGLQELNYNVLNEIKGIEYELSDMLTLVLPEDYVKYTRVSWIDTATGTFHPMVKNEDTLIAKSYLQDNDLNIIFDMTGNILTAPKNTYDPTLVANTLVSGGSCGARFGLETGKANGNGWFTEDKRSGLMKFSSNVGSKIIVLEYISDGLEYSDIDDIKVHKLAQKALMDFIEAAIIEKMDKIPEYVVKRKNKDAYLSAKQAKTRLWGLTYEELFGVLRGRGKHIK